MVLQPFLAALAGSSVHAARGVGGVHGGKLMDISQDILALATRRELVVSAGVKSVPHVGNTPDPLFLWRSEKLPAFRSVDEPWNAFCSRSSSPSCRGKRKRLIRH